MLRVPYAAFVRYITYLVLLVSLFPALSFAETRGFVISMFHIATNKHPDNCPKGGNGNYGDRVKAAFELLGYSKEKIAHMFSGKVHVGELYRTTYYRGKIDGKLVDVHTYPTAAPDPYLETVSGPYAYGFDLDGKGANQKSGFEDPETGEKGVDNQLFRVVGCFDPYRINLPNRPFLELANWEVLTAQKKFSAWLFSITGENLSEDGEATLEFHKAIGHFRADATGAGLSDLTYMIDPNPRSHGRFSGFIKDSIFTAGPEGAELFLEGQIPTFSKLELHNARLRVQLNQDRTATGYLAGYQPWMDFWYMNNAGGEQANLDTSALYYMLGRMSDARPDPVTGENTAISATYRLESVPAFLARSDGTFITDTHLR